MDEVIILTTKIENHWERGFPKPENNSLLFENISQLYSGYDVSKHPKQLTEQGKKNWKRWLLYNQKLPAIGLYISDKIKTNLVFLEIIELYENYSFKFKPIRESSIKSLDFINTVSNKLKIKIDNVNLDVYSINAIDLLEVLADLGKTPPEEWLELIDKNIILQFLQNLLNEGRTPPKQWFELIGKDIILEFLNTFADQIPNLKQQNKSNLINNWLNLIDSDLFNYLNNKYTNNIDEWPDIIKKYIELYRNALQLLCFKKNLKLESHIVNSFYNALKTKGFVILAGLSGTGKTKIFENFVKCFPEIDHNSKIKNHLFFSIRPDYKDSKSLLGFYNPLTQKYHSTPLLDFILKASRNYIEKGKEADPFFVLFDEMNLARVEYYFADFLSVLEAKRFESKDECKNNKEFVSFIKKLYNNENIDEKLNDNNYKFTSQSIKIHNENVDEYSTRNILTTKSIFYWNSKYR